MGKKLSKAATEALAATDWNKIDAMSDGDISRQIAANPDAAPDMAPEIDDARIRRRSVTCRRSLTSRSARICRRSTC